MNQEYLDCVNDSNEPSGEKKLRSEIHADGDWHRVVHIYFFRKVGETFNFLVHLRSKSKDSSPNKWDTRFGGHLKSGETVAGAVISEIKEELGYDLDLSKLIKGQLVRKKRAGNNEFTYIFYYPFDGDLSELSFVDNEVSEVKWLTSDQIVAELEDNDQAWSPSTKSFAYIFDYLKSILEK
ncbi:MAG: NUDIX domain-containing protein [Patescibacteria group bacterium]|nr:NUDIX domain-containing protein [Patescibacteria group bacterium]